MSIFENFGEVVSIKGKELAGKAKTLTNTAGLKGQITMNKNNINKTYRELGKRYFEAHKDDSTAEFKDLIQNIKSFEKSIEELQIKINNLNGTKHCTRCHADVPQSCDFCPKCGAKLEETYYDDEDYSVDDAKSELSSIMEEEDED